MSNPLKYVTSTPTGALRHANLGVGIASIQYDETFTSGITPNALTSYYLVYEPVNGASTRIYAPANSTELIQLAKSKGSTETTEAGALAWLSDNGYYPANKVLENIVTDGLILALYAGTATSYPTSGTNWLDLSGQAADAEAVNMPTLDENGYFEFDGTNDELHSVDMTQEYRDLCFICETDKSSGLHMLFGKHNDQDDSLRFEGNSLRGTGGVDANDWQFGSLSDVFINGEFDALSGGNYDMSGKMNFARSYRSNNSGFGTSFRYEISTSFMSRRFTGNLALILCYNRKLTDAEVNQNYFQGPIVTDDLKFALDASNLVSFKPGTTATYNLTGSFAVAAGDGVLTNGVGFSNVANGAWDFDGVDDYILYSSTQDVGTVFTVNFWIKPNGKARQSIVANGYPYQTNKGFFIACPGNTTNSDSFFLSLGADDNYVTAANGSLTQGVWQMVTCRVNGPGNLMKLYVNGTETNYSHQDNGNTTLQYDTGDFLTGRRTLASSDFLESPVSCIQMYNRALTEEEIQQNYNANVKKFT